MPSRTLFDKIWDMHRVRSMGDGRDLIFVDRHILQETTSAAAFAGLAESGRPVRRPEMTCATQDHIVSTELRRTAASNPGGRELIELMRRNASAHRLKLFGLDDARQGIVHVIGPELGLVLPGSVLACGDSHTSTAGGLGALGIGVGTSEVEHVLATQTLVLPRPKTLRMTFNGKPGHGMTAKDLVLHALGAFGISSGTGHAIEYAGETIRNLPIEGRLTVCNMSIEFGGRLGLIAPDEAAFDYVRGRPYAPSDEMLERALSFWRALYSDADAVFDRELNLDVSFAAPQITWGTTQQEVVGVDEAVPDPARIVDPDRRRRAEEMIGYMGLTPGRPIEGVPVDVVFIGACTNSRLSDLEAAAEIVRGKKVAENVRALVVPGSNAVKRAAEEKGLDRIFTDAGFEWRSAGCSMCVSINEDIVPPGARCLATSNRNFENRQGPRSRTHLVSPPTAAAAAIAGAVADVRKFA